MSVLRDQRVVGRTVFYKKCNQILLDINYVMVKNYIFKGTSFKALEHMHYQVSFTKIFISFS